MFGTLEARRHVLSLAMAPSCQVLSGQESNKKSRPVWDRCEY